MDEVVDGGNTPKVPLTYFNPDFEKEILGSLLVSEEALGDATATGLTPDHFSDKKNADLFHAAVRLAERGDPVSLSSLQLELASSGSSSKWDSSELALLLSGNNPASVSFYAEKVVETSHARQARDISANLQRQLAEPGDMSIADVIAQHTDQLEGVTAGGANADGMLLLEDGLAGTLDSIEHNSDRADAAIPTGFVDLDRKLSGGLYPGQMVIIAARPGVGKALHVDTPIPTPQGWTTMGELLVGDVVYGDDGGPAPVTGVTEVWDGRPCYRLLFSDGSSLIADAEHEWVTQPQPSALSHDDGVCDDDSSDSADMNIHTTEHIFHDMQRDVPVVHDIHVTQPLQQLLGGSPVLPPYASGVWLGRTYGLLNDDGVDHDELTLHMSGEVCAWRADGDRSGDVVNGLPELEHVNGKTVSGAHDLERLCDVLADMAEEQQIAVHDVVSMFARSSVAVRRSIVAGVLDSAGEVSGGECVQFSTDVKSFADGLAELLVSLGLSCSVHMDRRDGGGAIYTVAVSTDEELFRVSRKQVAHKEQCASRGSVPVTYRRIVSVERVPSVPVRCIEVGNDSHVYLAGSAMIPTHNSTLAMDFARAAALKHDKVTAFFSLEMGQEELITRLLSAHTNIPFDKLRTGNLQDAEWDRISQKSASLMGKPFFISDQPNQSIAQIKAEAKRLKKRHNLSLLIIDYLQLIITPGARPEYRQQAVSDISRSIKLLAKELEIPIVVLAQLNRGPEARSDKKPLMSDLRESGSLEQDADVVLLLHRDDQVNEASERAGECDIIIAKQRQGSTGTVAVAGLFHVCKLENMASGID